ncbi:MAG: hypothetical protein ACO3LE_09275 [Bdellovibrionota bacterium]
MRQIKRWIKVFGIFLGLAFVGGLIFISSFYFLNRQAIQDFTPSLSAFYAKSFCSCFFISERSLDECHEYSSQYIPIESFHIDESLKLIHVRALGEEARAQYENQREGCSLGSL